MAGCKKLSGQEKYRLRYGRYRIIYPIQDKELTIWIVKAIDSFWRNSKTYG
jgi:mRNA interferase RelE/StbE